MKPTTVQDLVDQVRSQIDEDNTAHIRTIDDILPALNRAQDHAAEILARHYPDPLIKDYSFSLVAGQDSYIIPEDAMGERINKMDILVPGFPANLKRVSYNQIMEYETLGTVAIPYGYCVIGRNIRIAPKPSGVYAARMWYMQSPQPLVLPWGRITRVDTVNQSITVDSLGNSEDEQPTTVVDDMDSYFNIIDAQTGSIKATCQVLRISGNRVDIRTLVSTDRPIVWGNTVVGAVDEAELDDYICPVGGSCVPILKNPFANFMIQFAVASMKRKLGDQSGAEDIVLKGFEEMVKSTWAGREQSQRVLKRSQYLSLPFRRYITGTR